MHGEHVASMAPERSQEGCGDGIVVGVRGGWVQAGVGACMAPDQSGHKRGHKSGPCMAPDKLCWLRCLARLSSTGVCVYTMYALSENVNGWWARRSL